jgi:hypothetical protein
MHKTTVTFAIETKEGVVQRIGKSVSHHPKIAYTGKGTKWFDDNQLLKANKEQRRNKT